MDAARAAAQAKATSAFALQRFLFLADNETPNPSGERFVLGRPVHVGFVLTGLAAAAGEHRVAIDLGIDDARGVQIYEQTDFFTQTFPVAEAPERAGLASLFATIDPPIAGRFTLRFVIRDLVARRSLEHRAALEVSAAR
jgi:hypothetical protein